MPPVKQRPPRVGNPGAPRSVHRRLYRRLHHGKHGAGANDASAARARCARSRIAGGAARSHAAPAHGPDAGTVGRKRLPRSQRLHRMTWTRQRAHKYRRAGWSMRTPTKPKCWTDSSQRATLLWHRLHRHGVGRGTVVKLPGQRDRCRAHLLRYRPRCTAASLQRRRSTPTASMPASPPLPKPIAPPAPAWPPCGAARQAHTPIRAKPGRQALFG